MHQGAMTSETIIEVRGMTCGHCAKTVERAARGVPGIEDANVELATGALTLRGDAPREHVVAAIRAAGYEA